MSDTPQTDAALRHNGSTYNDVVIRCENVIAVARRLERSLFVIGKTLDRVIIQRDDAEGRLQVIEGAWAEYTGGHISLGRFQDALMQALWLSEDSANHE